jgi:nucleotide-binding universal stress UspA family protein
MGVYKKMVVLLDGSELAEVVFEYAQEVSARMHVSVELLHVCSPDEVSQLPMRRAYIDRKAAELSAEAPAGAASRMQARGVVVVGYPAEEILKYVDENGIDLVMMSTHGSSGVKIWNLGEVANKVVHASRVPVWLVPTELREEVITDTLARRSMVVPLSGTEQSASAIPHAVSILTQRGAESELVLLHVMDMPYSVAQRAAVDDFDARREEMKRYLEGLAQPIRESGLTVRTEILLGDGAQPIIDYLKDNPTQLLVMATSGKSRVNRMIFGSVTEGVIHLVKVTPLVLINGHSGPTGDAA